jgi:hypothetical protein
VSLALSRFQAACKSVRIVPVEYRESRRGPVEYREGSASGQCGRRGGGAAVRPAGPGARVALIRPDIGKYTISVFPDIVKHKE